MLFHSYAVMGGGFKSMFHLKSEKSVISSSWLQTSISSGSVIYCNYITTRKRERKPFLYIIVIYPF